MKNLICAGALVLASAAQAQAALPPTAESLRRFAAIAQSSDVFDAFGAVAFLKSINDNGNGQYTVDAGDCVLSVQVEAVQTNPPQMVPPLKVTVGQMNCTPKN